MIKDASISTLNYITFFIVEYCSSINKNIIELKINLFKKFDSIRSKI